MNELSIEEKPVNNGVAVDLMSDNAKVDTGSNPIYSYGFWEDMEKCSQRALHRIEKKNPTIKFEFDLRSMMLTDEQKKEQFLNHAKSKLPEIDVDRALKILADQVATIKLDGPVDDHPNPYMKFRIDSDLVKMLVCNVLKEYNTKNETI